MSALKAATYEEPTPIQAGLIPLALEEVDVVGQARTGTGKTAAFVIPILELLDLEASHKNPQALILVPTRELAVQVKEEVEKLSMGMRAHCVALYGGTPIRGQIAKLKRGSKSLSELPDAFSITCPAIRSISVRSIAWFWTKPTGCSTSDFGPIWKRSCGGAPKSDKHCCSAQPCRPQLNACPKSICMSRRSSTFRRARSRLTRLNSIILRSTMTVNSICSFVYSIENNRPNRLSFAAPSVACRKSTRSCRENCEIKTSAACMVICSNANATV